MKRLNFLCMMLSLSTGLKAQVTCPTNLYIYQQSIIDNFTRDYPGCATIKGDLFIVGSQSRPIINLKGLSGITSIAGTLEIGELAMINLSGLDNLKSVGGVFKIIGNKNIVNLEGLSNLTSLSSYIQIESSESLKSLAGMTKLKTIGGILLKDNKSLKSLTGLSGLTAITGRSYFYKTFLTDLNGLENVRAMGGVDIESNADLQNVSGLRNVVSLVNENYISMRNNPLLTNCHVDIICQKLVNSVFVSNNASGCSSPYEIEGSCNSPLPVSLIDFTAKKEGVITQLTWSTTFETNSKEFLVQHSKDGKFWDEIGKLESGRNSGTRLDYHFGHNAPSPGNNYYRLRMVDQDNSFANSKITHVYFEETMKVDVYPNPVSDLLKIDVYDWLNVTDVQLISANGTVVYQSGLKPAKTIDVSRIGKGIHFVMITKTDKSVLSQKVLVSR